MKVKTISRFTFGAILAVVAATSQAGVSISIGSPGFYGAIDIGGGAPPPALVYQQPIAIQPVVVAAPLYLYVPPEQYVNWGAYCFYYNACNRSVYFVDRGWYQQVYVPHYRRHHHEYALRRAEFRHYAYRADRHPPPPHVDHRRPPPRVDNHRPPVREVHRNAPPRPENHRPPAREEHRKVPPHPQGRDDHGRR